MAGRGERRLERERRFREIEREVFEAFCSRMEELRSVVDAHVLVLRAPPPDAPGRRYYSNLGTFLASDFCIPAGAGWTELGLYAGFIERIEAAGELKPGDGKLLVERIRAAMKQRAPGL